MRRTLPAVVCLALIVSGCGGGGKTSSANCPAPATATGEAKNERTASSENAPGSP